MKSPTLLIDLGNTRLKWALADDVRIGAVSAMDWPSDGLPLTAWREAGIVGIGVASVAPSASRERLLESLSALKVPVIEAMTSSSWHGLSCAYPKPETFGIDRWLALIAAYTMAPDETLLVVGAGTALTIDLLDRHGWHRGGVIAPGLAAMREGLFTKAPALAKYPAGIASTGVADGSANAIASGCLQAALGVIDRHRYAAGSISLRRVILSGGDAEKLATHLPMPHDVRPWLVLEGLAHWLAAPSTLSR